MAGRGSARNVSVRPRIESGGAGTRSAKSGAGMAVLLCRAAGAMVPARRAGESHRSPRRSPGSTAGSPGRRDRPRAPVGSLRNRLDPDRETDGREDALTAVRVRVELGDRRLRELAGAHGQHEPEGDERQAAQQAVHVRMMRPRRGRRSPAGRDQHVDRTSPGEGPGAPARVGRLRPRGEALPRDGPGRLVKSRRTMQDGDRRVHPYIPNAVPEVRAAMLRGGGRREHRGASTPTSPSRLRLRRPLDLPAPLRSEAELVRHVEGLLGRNTSTRDALSFLGAGCYRAPRAGRVRRDRRPGRVPDRLRGRARTRTTAASRPSSSTSR